MNAVFDTSSPLYILSTLNRIKNHFSEHVSWSHDLIMIMAAANVALTVEAKIFSLQHYAHSMCNFSSQTG